MPAAYASDGFDNSFYCKGSTFSKNFKKKICVEKTWQFSICFWFKV